MRVSAMKVGKRFDGLFRLVSARLLAKRGTRGDFCRVRAVGRLTRGGARPSTEAQSHSRRHCFWSGNINLLHLCSSRRDTPFFASIPLPASPDERRRRRRQAGRERERLRKRSESRDQEPTAVTQDSGKKGRYLAEAGCERKKAER